MTGIDSISARWAWSVGVEHAARFPNATPGEWHKLCPFVAGTPHELWWRRGFMGTWIREAS